MLYAIIVVLLLIADQGLKYWVTVHVALNEGRHVLIPHVLDIMNIHNYGIAFSWLQNVPSWVFALIAALFAVVVILALRRGAIHGAFGRWMAVLALAGAIGNCIDRVLSGYVVDMLAFAFWKSFPVFNLADACLVVGGIAFCLYVIFHKEAPVAAQQRAKRRSASAQPKEAKAADTAEKKPAAKKQPKPEAAPAAAAKSKEAPAPKKQPAKPAAEKAPEETPAEDKPAEKKPSIAAVLAEKRAALQKTAAAHIEKRKEADARRAAEAEKQRAAEEAARAEAGGRDRQAGGRRARVRRPVRRLGSRRVRAGCAQQGRAGAQGCARSADPRRPRQAQGRGRSRSSSRRAGQARAGGRPRPCGKAARRRQRAYAQGRREEDRGNGRQARREEACGKAGREACCEARSGLAEARRARAGRRGRGQL